MSIVPLKKVSLIGILDEKEQVLAAAQKFGQLHLIPLTSAQRELEAIPSGKASHAVEALRWLLNCPAQRRAATSPEGFDLDQVVNGALSNKRAIKACEDRRDRLTRRIREVRPWGEFRFTDLEDLGGYRLWFYVVPSAKLSEIDPSNKILQIVHQDRYRAYVVVLSPEEPTPDAMPVKRTHVGAIPLSELEHDLEQTEIELEGLQLDRQSMTKWSFLLGQNLAAARDHSARARAALETADDGRVFVLQAWGRADQMEEIGSLAAELGIAVLFEDPDETEKPPSLLENAPSLAAGEDLVSFYQTPGYRDWDPSVIVYISFVLFFGMIMTDAGYGLLLLGLLYLLRGRFGGSPLARRLHKMSVWLMVSTTAFGIATGSYFGIVPPEGSWLGALKVLELKDVDTMMKITLTIGVIHIVIANLMRARHGTALPDKLQPLGWVLVAAGGLATFLGMGTILESLGPLAVATGLLTVGFFGSNRQVTSLSSGALRLFDGLASVARVVNIFSDVLSYMRLFALGLAAASLAETINTLSSQLYQSVPGIGLLVALFVLVLGHAINIGLGLIAGCVHGLRLNVIEFFNWGLKDEGTPFRPFRKEETRL